MELSLTEFTKSLENIPLFIFSKIFLNITLTSMESSALFFTVFLWCLLVSITGYSIYVGFGPPSKQLRDPFEEHED